MTSSFYFFTAKKHRFDKITSVYLWKPLKDHNLPILNTKTYDQHPYPHTFKFAVSKIYEEIPASLKTFRFNQFKFHCKLFFLSKQIKS